MLYGEGRLILQVREGGGAKLAQGGHQARVHSDQLVLVMARRKAGPCERWPKALKGELENNSGNQRT
jgi:hypothetical protein